MMKRYLMYFSYIGSGFRGLQRQIPRNLITFNIVPAVTEVIEDALRLKLNLPQIPILHTASRTDAGVHALRTCAHVDLDVPAQKSDKIVITLNHHFKKISCPIRILSIQRVSDDFSSRYFPVRRSYLYRFAVIKHDTPGDDFSRSIHLLPTPITEYLRCHFVGNPVFNVDAVNDVLPLFIGTHDFRTFMALSGSGSRKIKNIISEDILTTRNLDSFTLTRGKPFLESFSNEHFDYWELRCSGRSFLYKQVRRMVSVILNVGNGTFTADDVKYMLDNPSHKTWNWKKNITTVPGYGLYLTDVVFKDEDLIPPVEPEEKPEHSSDLKISPKDVIGLSINEKINLRLKKLKMENNELSGDISCDHDVHDSWKRT